MARSMELWIALMLASLMSVRANEAEGDDWGDDDEDGEDEESWMMVDGSGMTGPPGTVTKGGKVTMTRNRVHTPCPLSYSFIVWFPRSPRMVVRTRSTRALLSS